MKHHQYSKFQSIQDLEKKLFELAEIYSVTEDPTLRVLINNEMAAVDFSMKVKTKELLRQYHIQKDGTTH